MLWVQPVRFFIFPGTWTFTGKVVFEDKVIVTGLVNDRKLEDLYRYALRLDTPVFPNFKRVVFANNIQVGYSSVFCAVRVYTGPCVYPGAEPYMP